MGNSTNLHSLFDSSHVVLSIRDQVSDHLIARDSLEQKKSS